MLTSSRRGLSYPNPATRADRADVPTDIATLIAALELDVVFGQGTLATRPAAGAGAPVATGGGRFWWATDSSALYYDTGSAWIGPINQQALGANSITTAMLQDDSVTAAKIALGAVGASEIADGSIGTVELAAALFPSQGAGAGTEAFRAIGSGAGQVLAGNDVRVPTYGAAFPSSGLVNGYRFTLFTSAIGGVSYAIDCVYRADLDGAYPWHVCGGQPIIASSVASSTLTINAPRAGMYNVRAVYASVGGSGSLALTGSSRNPSFGTNNSVNVGSGLMVIEDGPIAYTNGQAVVATFTSGGGSSATNFSLVLTPLKLA